MTPENDTRQRIITAAYLTFARLGIAGATTREIARVAKVNEVTLFRYFKSKQQLLGEMVQDKCRTFEKIFAGASFATSVDLRRAVTDYAHLYERLLHENEDFVRTFYGELSRYPKLGRDLFLKSSQGKREAFVQYLQAAQKRKLVRKELDLVIVIEAFNGMLIAGVLRRPIQDVAITREAYVKNCVELFLRGIET